MRLLQVQVLLVAQYGALQEPTVPVVRQRHLKNKNADGVKSDDKRWKTSCQKEIKRNYQSLFFPFFVSKKQNYQVKSQ